MSGDVFGVIISIESAFAMSAINFASHLVVDIPILQHNHSPTSFFILC